MSKTLVWAHRGASGYAPANTLMAFQKAIEMKADGIELDVQMTKDGELVIIHDEKVNKLSDGTGWVKDFTYEEIQKLNVNLKFPELGTVNIPTLEEVYNLVKDTDLIINVELKNAVVIYENLEEKVVALTNKMDLSHRVIYSSFNHYSVLKIKELCPNAKTGFIYEQGFIDMHEYAKKYKVDALHPGLHHLQYPNFINNCKESGIDIRVWTVNSEKDMRKMCEYGIDMITNYPDIGKKVVDEYNK